MCKSKQYEKENIRFQEIFWQVIGSATWAVWQTQQNHSHNNDSQCAEKMQLFNNSTDTETGRVYESMCIECCLIHMWNLYISR